MDEVNEIKKDERFSHLLHDPKFRKMKKNERKVKIDSRFKSMFTDKNFKLKYSVDKRGRPIKSSTNENLKRYYELSESEEESEDDKEDETEDRKSDDDKKSERSDNESGDDSEESSESSEIHSKKSKVMDSKKLKDKVAKKKKASKQEESDDEDSEPDYARGAGLDSSSSSSDEEQENNEDKESANDEVSHQWGELDRDAPMTNDATSRLAICNMDWDRIKAVDLLVLLNSFKPDTGIVKSVTIYPSDYGLERMKREEAHGPTELVEKTLHESEDEDTSEQGQEYHREKLRKYQMNRLRYYYAVAECDSAETADKIYTNCNGLEYESSATVLDLRFIPDDMEFDHEPSSTATSLPVEGTYKPSIFVNTALHQSNVTLTWDETPADRIAVTMRDFSKEELKDLDVKDYLASGSESDEERIEQRIQNHDENVSIGGSEDDEDNIDIQIKKYKDLLKDVQDDGSKEDDFDMEITWEPGLKETTEKLVEKKRKSEQVVTPWEQYLEKKKLKRRKKRQDKKKGDNVESEESEDEYKKLEAERLASDEEQRLSSKDLKKRKKKLKKFADKNISEKEMAELELLVADGAKKSSKVPKDGSTKGKIEDPRFKALYEDPAFNVDPSAPEFAKKKKKKKH